jgi:twitching motility protein PilT
VEMIDLLRSAVEAGASDVHISVGQPPMIRKGGVIDPLGGFQKLDAEETKRLIYSILYEDQIQRFEEKYELDSSFDVPGLSRFRVNVLVQKNGVEAVLRIIPSKIPDPRSLGLTKAILSVAQLPRGLVLMTGPTGSGKSTTLACLLELINQSRKEHILTIEDPIEFVYESKSALIRQREVGTNTHSFKDALRHALRQDPDIILVGEMRDLETISLAISAAETGHLVLATLHTQDAPQTVDRVIDVFPPAQQEQIRVQLAACLRIVVCQELLPRLDGRGRIAAREVMVNSPAVANLIREGKTHMIYSAIETGAKLGMIDMDAHMAHLVREKLVRMDVALAKAHNPQILRQKASSVAPPGAMRGIRKS